MKNFPEYDAPVAPNPWGVETEHGPATRVPTHDEALASMRKAHAEFKARQAAHRAEAEREAAV